MESGIFQATIPAANDKCVVLDKVQPSTDCGAQTGHLALALYNLSPCSDWATLPVQDKFGLQLCLKGPN